MKLRYPVLYGLTAITVWAQGLDPAALLKPGSTTWPTYNGDYSGKRFSQLDLINRQNVASLALAWALDTHVPMLKCTPLLVNGVLYFTAPDHAWASDARTGRQIWHFRRPSTGNHIAQRGVAIYKDRIFFGTPDAHLISLDARTGRQIWDVQVADSAFGYYLSMAPLVVKGHLVIGTSGDQADVPHFVEALDPENGHILWRWNTVPKPGEAGSETWPGGESMSHGGGPAWMTGTYDPQLNLIYLGTGNPHPVLAGGVRKGANLYTCTIVALDPDTGKLVWYFQPSPHDTHDWDAVETPVLFDAEFHGKSRKLLAQASRNGYFFLLDRTTGQNLVTSQFVSSNWASGVDTKGSPTPDPQREPQPDGALVRMAADGATNWMAPSFSPQTGLFYVSAMTGYSIWYLSPLSENAGADDHQGGGARDLLAESELVAINYRTGKVTWTRKGSASENGASILTTAGGLLFTGDGDDNLLALDALSGEVLWHTTVGNLSGSPMTYALDDRQYIITCVGGMIYAWSLPGR